MSDFNNAWLTLVIRRLQAGEPYTQELVSQSVRELNADFSSDKSIEAWINVLWQGSKDIPREEFLAVRHQSAKSRSALLHKILT